MLEIRKPQHNTPEDLDRGDAPITPDTPEPAELVKSLDEMNVPEEELSGEDSIFQDPVEGMYQSATNMLRADHVRVSALFEQYQTAGGVPSPDAQIIAEQVCEELDIHSLLEEEIFYPAVREAAGDEAVDFVVQSFEDHARLKNLISDLRAREPGTPEHDEAFRALIDEVTAHVEQEESMLIPFAEDALGDGLIDLGQRMIEMRAQLDAPGESLFAAVGGTGRSGI